MNPDILRIGAVLIAIIALIVFVTRFQLHPFLALIVVSIFLGLVCGLPPVDVIKHFEKGFGDVLSFVGIVIALGAMLGGLLVFSGGAEKFATALVSLAEKSWCLGQSFSPHFSLGFPSSLRSGSYCLCRSPSRFRKR
jgi:GntP family gluconate:H+ symporter